MKKILILLMILIVFLAGCSADEVFFGKAISYNGLSIGDFSEIKEVTQDTTIAGDELYNGVLAANNTTCFKEYIEVYEELFSIDTQIVLEDYIVDNGFESASMPREDYLRLVMLNDDEAWNQYRLVVDNDLLYIVNSDNIVMEEYCMILMSRNNEVKEALISGGYENLYKIIENYDSQIISQIDSKVRDIPMYSMDTHCCGITVNMKSASFWKHSVQIPTESLYLTKLYQNDEWIIQGAGANSVCESISFLYTAEEYTPDVDDDWSYINVRLDLYGSENELRIIKITYDKRIESIPLNCRFTITECLKALGCTDDEINGFYEELPQKSGNIGKLYYVTDEIDVDNKTIKLYVK